MLRIQSVANSLYLQLNEPTIELELNNWLLADSDELPGSFSYPISFPWSDNNKKFFAHTHLPEAKTVDHQVYVWLNGIMLRKSSISYKKEKRNGSGYLKIDAGEVANKIKGKYLYEVFTEKYNFGSSLANVSLLMLAAAKAEPGVYPFAFFPVYNEAFAPKEIEGNPSYVHYNYVNAWDGENFQVTQNRHIVPFLYLTYVIKTLSSFLGFTATGSFLNHPEVRALTLYNTKAIPTTPFLDGFVLNLGMHVPYITIGDFLKALRNDFGLGIFFDTTTMEARFEMFEDIRDNVSATKDITPFILRFYESDLPDNKGFAMSSYEDDSDLYYNDVEPVTVKIREGQKDIKASFGALKMQRLIFAATPETTLEWLVPSAHQNGNLYSLTLYGKTEFYSTQANHKNAFGLRLISYRGMQPGKNGVLYPFGSCITRAYDQTTIGTWSIEAKQSDSIFNQVTVPFYQFLANTKRIRYEFLFPVSLIKNLPFYIPYAIKGENRVITRSLIERLNVALPGRHGTVAAKATVFTLVPSEANPNQYQGEMFYVEMIISNERSEQTEDREIFYADFTFRVWADPEKTIPANPTNLVILYEEYNTSTSTSGTVNVTNFYNFAMSGHQFFLPNLITGDQNPGEQITIVYGLTFSSDYVII